MTKLKDIEKFAELLGIEITYNSEEQYLLMSIDTIDMGWHNAVIYCEGLTEEQLLQQLDWNTSFLASFRNYEEVINALNEIHGGAGFTFCTEEQRLLLIGLAYREDRENEIPLSWISV